MCVVGFVLLDYRALDLCVLPVISTSGSPFIPLFSAHNLETHVFPCGVLLQIAM